MPGVVSVSVIVPGSVPLPESVTAPGSVVPVSVPVPEPTPGYVLSESVSIFLCTCSVSVLCSVSVPFQNVPRSGFMLISGNFGSEFQTQSFNSPMTCISLIGPPVVVPSDVGVVTLSSLEYAEYLISIFPVAEFCSSFPAFTL